VIGVMEKLADFSCLYDTLNFALSFKSQWAKLTVGLLLAVIKHNEAD